MIQGHTILHHTTVHDACASKLLPSLPISTSQLTTLHSALCALRSGTALHFMVSKLDGTSLDNSEMMSQIETYHTTLLPILPAQCCGTLRQD